MGFREDIQVEPRDGTDKVLGYIDKQTEAPTTYEIAEDLQIPKGRVASILQTLVRSGRIKQYHHLNKNGKVQKLLNGHLYYTNLKQVMRRLQRPESLLDKQMGKASEVIADRNQRGFFCYFGDIEQEIKIPRHLLKAHLRRIDNLALGLVEISVEGRTCFYFDKILSDDRIETAKEAVVTTDAEKTSGLLCIPDGKGDTENLMEGSSQYGEFLLQELHDRPVGSKRWFAMLAHIIGLGNGKVVGNSNSYLCDVIHDLDVDELRSRLGSVSEKSVTNLDISRFLIDFYSQIEGVSRKDFIEDMRSDEGKEFRDLCRVEESSIPTDYSLSKMKRRIGEGLQSGYEFMRDHILSKLNITELKLSDYRESLEELSSISHERVRRWNRLLGRSNEAPQGFQIFLEFIEKLGIIPEVLGAFLDNKGPNGLDIGKLIEPMLMMNFIDAIPNYYKLSSRLQTEDRLGLIDNLSIPQSVTPNTFQNNLKLLDPELLQEAMYRINSAFLTLMNKTHIDIALDITEIDVKGKYPDALKVYIHEITWDPSNPDYLKNKGKKKGRKKKATKPRKAIFILTAYEISTSIPLYTVILKKENYQKCNILLQAIDVIEQKYGKEIIRNVLFDRGFYEYMVFNTINRKLIGFVTPNKSVGDLKRIMNETPIEKFQKIKRRDDEYVHAYETYVKISDYEGDVRFVVIEDTYEKELYNGKVVKKKRRYGYLTNISRESMSMKEISRTYSKRWCVETFFDKMKNQWNLKRFPSTDPVRVRNHLFLNLICYSTLSFLKYLWRMGNITLKTMRGTFFMVLVEIGDCVTGPVFVQTRKEKSKELVRMQSKVTFTNRYGFDRSGFGRADAIQV